MEKLYTVQVTKDEADFIRHALGHKIYETDKDINKKVCGVGKYYAIVNSARSKFLEHNLKEKNVYTLSEILKKEKLSEPDYYIEVLEMLERVFNNTDNTAFYTSEIKMYLQEFIEQIQKEELSDKII